MRLVILGAGATFDCLPTQGGPRPPLAKDLFADRPVFGKIIDRYPSVRPLVPRLRAAATDGSVSIEREFEQIVAEANNGSRVRRQLLAARYYLHDAVEVSTEQASDSAHGLTNYHQLVDRLGAWLEGGKRQVCFVTFNYDRLLERAVTDSIGQRFDDIDAYISNPALRVIKLHGSVGWRRRTGLAAEWDGNMPGGNAAWIIDRLDKLDVSDEFEVGSPHIFVQGRPVGVPAIAVPTENKTAENFEAPLPHLAALKAALPEVVEVLVIGWRGHENHFWALWNECRPSRVKMNVVAVDANERQAREVALTLAEHGIAARVKPLSVAGFSGYARDATGLPGLLV